MDFKTVGFMSGLAGFSAYLRPPQPPMPCPPFRLYQLNRSGGQIPEQEKKGGPLFFVRERSGLCTQESNFDTLGGKDRKCVAAIDGEQKENGTPKCFILMFVFFYYSVPLDCFFFFCCFHSSFIMNDVAV